MSIIPEFVLQALIARGIRAFKSDHRFIDQLFRNMSQEAVDQIRNFIVNNTFDISINYPKDTPKVPAVIILLKSETEAQTYLADTMGYDVPDIFSYDGGIDGEILGGAASVSSLSGEGVLVFGPMVAGGGSSSAIQTTEDEFYSDEFVGRNLKVRIVGGKGAGQVRSISSNDPNEIFVTPNWTVTPDATSIFEVRASEEEVIGQPSKLYDRRNGTPFIERRGAMYTVNAQLQIIGPNPEMTIVLYSIIKSIVYVSRIFLEKQGLINLKISGTDFLPKTEYFPDLAYTRALNMEFSLPFDVFEDADPVVDEIKLILEAQDPIVITPSVVLTV